MLLGRSEQGFIYVFEEPVRILAVDDDPIMREMATAQLSHPGGEVVTAQDGQEAWEVLDGDPHFDLVLSDLEMPRMTGFGLCAAIREDMRFARLPVVVLTGREDMFAIDRAYEVGATSFATKPVNWRMLGYQLRYVLRNSRDNEAALAAARRDMEPGEPDAALQDPDPALCLQVLLAQSPDRIAAIIAQSNLDPEAGAILGCYADLVTASAREAAPEVVADISSESCGQEAADPWGQSEKEAAPLLHGGPVDTERSCGGPVAGDPVAAMRAQLRQGVQRQGEHANAPRDPMRSFRFLANGGRS
ncbi:MAG: response regulator [Salinarimonas sp.]|nr:response regulator [Salinarimonas sp.]